ncbi:MAG: hypothetical protein CMH56_04750 [Myxococcales bacterium]|nr:hypothetical protein [Myxococcales bacterium]
MFFSFLTFFRCSHGGLLGLMALSLLWSPMASANSAGIWGKTGRTESCVTCHVPGSQAAGREPLITISPLGAPEQWVAGTEVGFEVKARRAVDSDNRYGAFNAEVRYGPLGNLQISQVGNGVKMHTVLGENIEVSHSARKDFLQGAVLENDQTFYELTWSFHVRLPAHFPLQGDHQLELFAAVNNTNGAGTSGDYVNTAQATFELPALAIECGKEGAAEPVCDASTFDSQVHYFEQTIPCCCPDADGDGFMAAFCNPNPGENGGDCLDEGEFAERANPEASETISLHRCDLMDNDCNGIVDDQFFPELGPVCDTNADCPEGYYCNASRIYLEPRCGLGCAEVSGGEENTSYICSTGSLQCLDTTVVELCNGVDDDQDGLIDEDFVNGVPPLGSTCDLMGRPGQVMCDEVGTGMICGDIPVIDAGSDPDDAGHSEPGTGGPPWVQIDGGYFVPAADGGWMAAIMPDGGWFWPSHFDAGEATIPDANLTDWVDAGVAMGTAQVDAGQGERDAGFIDIDSGVMAQPNDAGFATSMDGGQMAKTGSEDKLQEPIEEPQGCGCHQSKRSSPQSFNWLILFVGGFLSYLRRLGFRRNSLK